MKTACFYDLNAVKAGRANTYVKVFTFMRISDARAAQDRTECYERSAGQQRAVRGLYGETHAGAEAAGI